MCVRHASRGAQLRRRLQCQEPQETLRFLLVFAWIPVRLHADPNVILSSSSELLQWNNSAVHWFPNFCLFHKGFQRFADLRGCRITPDHQTGMTAVRDGAGDVTRFGVPAIDAVGRRVPRAT